MADVSLLFTVRLYKSAVYFIFLQFVQAVGLNKKKFHIVGESMGGHIAGVYSATHPSSIEKTTLMCPHGIKFDQMDKMKAEYERTGHCILLPDSLKTVREMFECVLHKKFPFPDFVLNGILQMRLENDDFNKKRKLLSCYIFLCNELIYADELSLKNQAIKLQ